MFFKTLTKRQLGLRIAALGCSLMMLSALPSDLASMKANAASLSDMQAESERLKKEAQALQSKISSQEKNLTDQKAYKNALDKKIDNIKAQLDLYSDRIEAMTAKINSLNSNMETKEAEINQKEQDIETRFEALRIRLRAISKSGNYSTLQMLMDTDNYTDYLIKSKMMERVAQNDQALMEELEAEIQVIEDEKAALQTDKNSVSTQMNEVQKLKNEADTQKKELDTLYAKANAALQKIQSNIKDYNQQLKSTKEEQEKLEAQINAIIHQSNYNGTYVGPMLWPVPTVRAISSYYGWRWGSLHRGVDIANGSIPIYGQKIVAAYSGTVIYANYTSTWGGGYGYYVIIDHGKDSKGRKISSLYAHCSKVYARVGDKVVGGQTVIALAGSTGDVTGPHLHFEVRVNGTAVDPIANGYIKL